MSISEADCTDVRSPLHTAQLEGSNPPLSEANCTDSHTVAKLRMGLLTYG